VIPDVVVVGNGMAGSRVAAEIAAREPERRVTVLGDEPAYNRVLLSAVLAGTAREPDIALARPVPDVRLTRVLALDRTRRVVRTPAGEVPYGTVVLATGGEPRLPPVTGLSTDLPGLHTFRDLTDCAAIGASGARRAVVLGGGLLGLEAARGLAGRGVEVTVVHAGPHLMERQLDAAAGRVLAGTLDLLGVRTLVGADTVAVLGTDRFRGLLLAGGERVHAELLVVACGVRPSVALARDAGLPVRAGVVVDDRLRTADPHVYAIGDCAEHRGRVYGLVAPAWEQAAVAAASICGAPARYTGSTLVTRLKAAGVELAAMGEVGDAGEVVQFADTARGTYKKLLIRDGRLAGAILLGDVSTVGLVTQLYDRGAPVPPDRLGLLFGGWPAAGAGTDAAALPDGATVCRCNGVSKAAIVTCARAGARSVTEIAARTRATTGCGGCAGQVAELLAGTGEPVPARVAG
jgi:assimilatory nitrate reductase electron transfer subunit